MKKRYQLIGKNDIPVGSAEKVCDLAPAAEIYLPGQQQDEDRAVDCLIPKYGSDRLVAMLDNAGETIVPEKSPSDVPKKEHLQMPQLAQPRTGETAQERQQRRDALLRYGHIFADTHRQVSSLRHRDETLEDRPASYRLLTTAGAASIGRRGRSGNIRKRQVKGGNHACENLRAQSGQG